MLAHLPSSTDYNNFIHSLPSEYSNLLSCKLIDPQYVSAVFKMTHLDVDSISDLLPLAYSHTGRPAVKQMEILRSFVLMLHFKCVSIKQWCKSLTDKPVRAILIGCLPGEAPSASNHYDFISRLFGGFKYHSIYPPKRYGKPKDSKPKKNNKWENNPPHITEQAFDFYLNNDYDNNRVEFLLQQIFDKIAVEFSVSHNLIDTSNPISASGDGSAFHIHSSSRGHRVITCPEDKDDPECLRRYSDPEANWGWDSDTEQYFFGYNIYTCCYYNKKYKFDLSLFLTMDRSSIHDSLNSITSFCHFRSINNYLRIKHYCLDSASDNISTHQLLINDGIAPLIDINKRKGLENPYEAYENLSATGKPICPGGFEMTYWGYEKKRQRSKYRCPLATNKINQCSCCESCKTTEYGKSVYLKSKDDPRLFGEIQYKSAKWIEIYKNRTSCERMNNRILNHYRLKDCFMHTRPRLMFIMMIIGINIHLDAFQKMINS